MQKLHDIDELLFKLQHVKRLYCDEDLEKYIFENRETKLFLPSLIEMNRVSINITE